MSLKIDDILSCYEGGVNTFWENKAENEQADRMMTRTLYRYGKTLCTDREKTLLLDKAIEYTRTTVVQHTSNEWQKGEYDRYTRSNRVYQMNYHIYENTRYDREKQQSVPYSCLLYTSPSPRD